ncbi:MAG: Ig-like domain-containing protein, partial [Methanosarcinales archaeon]|nr:Ig-like domain-containing protein [Methanosarcinales archaeon]
FSEAMNQTSAESAFNTSPETTGSFTWNGNIMTYTPDSDLTSDTTYEVTIGTGSEDLAGIPLAVPYTWDFTTAAESDTTAPTVTDNTPTGTDVPVTTVITVTFNESMNTTSVEDAFSIDPSVTGTLSWSGNTMTLTPDADLAYSTMHEVTIGTGSEDLAGIPLAVPYTWDFTTAAESDTTAPTVTDNTPTGTDVPVTTVITVTFNESMNTTSVEDAFSIDPSVTGTLSWSGNTMTLTPDADLAYSTMHEVTIGTGSEDLAGIPLAVPYTWDFTTAAESDTTAPTVTDNTPTGTDVPVTTVITVTFNESMNTTSVEDAFSIDPSVTGTLSWSGDTMTFTPTSDLASYTKYTVTIGTGAKDLAGNNLQTEHTWNFTTEVSDNTPPIATITEPDDGACIKGIINIIGTANDTNFKNYSVEWKNTTDVWIEIRNSTESVSGGILATWDTNVLEDGDYMIRLTVKDDNASNSNKTLVNVTIDNTPPAVSNVTAQPDIINISGHTNITAELSGLGVDNVLVNVTYPNGTHLIIDMNNNSQVYYWNFSNTADPGRYNVTIIANDTTGNVNDTQKTSFIVAHICTNTTIKTNADNSTFINAPGTNVTLELFTNGSVTGSINITRSIVNITDELEVPGPGIYIRINASTNFSNDTDSNLSWALIKVNYTDEDVSNNNLVESSLRLYWYNESSGNWIKLETNSPTWVYGSGVDTANNYVWANVSHFSDYAVGGELEKETPPPSNGGGGSSGGGGGTSGENYYNILVSETDRQSIFKNSDVSFIFDLEDNIVRHINFTALKSAGTVAAKVEILNNTSTLVSTPPPNKVYKNLNMWVGNAGWATKRNIADATVVFTVDKSWITENNIDETSIVLYRYSDDTWHKLVTRKIAENADSLQFEAETPGFSPFAVTGKEEEGDPDREGIIAEPTVTVDKTPVPTPTDKKGIPGFGLFAGLSILLIAMQLLRKKK